MNFVFLASSVTMYTVCAIQPLALLLHKLSFGLVRISSHKAIGNTYKPKSQNHLDYAGHNQLEYLPTEFPRHGKHGNSRFNDVKVLIFGALIFIMGRK